MICKNCWGWTCSKSAYNFGANLSLLLLRLFLILGLIWASLFLHSYIKSLTMMFLIVIVFWKYGRNRIVHGQKIHFIGNVYSKIQLLSIGYQHHANSRGIMKFHLSTYVELSFRKSAIFFDDFAAFFELRGLTRWFQKEKFSNL